jgi:hypothetical protein
MPVHPRHVCHGPAVFDRSPDQRRFVQGQAAILQVEPFAGVGLAQVVGRGLEITPGQRSVPGMEGRFVVVVGCGVHVVARVNRVKGEAGRRAPVNVGRRLQVIGVGAQCEASLRGPFVPAFLEDTPGGVVHDLVRAAACSSHLADGLLGEDHRQARVAGPLPDHLRRSHVTGRGDSQSVAAAGRGAQA